MISPATQSNVLHVYTEDFSNPTPTPHDAARVVFVRHGECYNNLKDVMESKCSDEHPDIHNGLTLKGRGQASDAGHFLLERTPNVEAIFTSPNMRAQETAKIVTEVFQESEKSTPAITVKQELREEFFGPMERHTFKPKLLPILRAGRHQIGREACLRDECKVETLLRSEGKLDRSIW
jgi:hypothetical protein